jgi:flagellin-like protein
MISKRRKAISPIIATIILIVITVAVGGLLYAYVSGMFGSMSTSQSVDIQNTFTIPSGSSVGTWTITVKNTGTVSITGMKAYLYSPGNTTPIGKNTFTLTTLSPGQTASATNMSISGGVAGSSYDYQLVVTFANGVSKTYTGSVTAEIY